MGEYLKTATILYVEDNNEVRIGYAKAIGRFAKELYTASDGDEGLDLFVKHSPDIVITDIKMPHLDGIKMAQKIRQLNPEQIIIFTTAYTDADYTLPALDLQIDGYLLKPIDKKKLENKIEHLSKNIFLEKRNLEQQLMLEQILHHQSSITIVTDFKTIKFASRSFWNMLYVKDWNTFFEMYDTVLDIFVEHEHYIYGNTKSEFLKKYYDRDEGMRLVSIIGEDGPTAFYVSLDEVYHAPSELFILTLTDVSSLQESRLDALYNATHDKLTKIYNRSAFEKTFEHELLRVKRYERPLCIAILDIDYFKQFNDSFGHLIGDEVLVMLAKEISKKIRNTDVFARWGGEEFIILMSEADIKKGQKIADMVRKCVEALKHPTAGNVTVSIGLTQVLPEDTYKTLFERCDAALYKAKTNGRNRIKIL